MVLSVIDKIRAITALEPHSQSLDLQNLDLDPPVVIATGDRKHKPTVADVDRAGKGLIVNPSGYIDLRLRTISRYMFRTTLAAKAQ